MLVHAMNKSQRTTNLPFALLVIISLLGFPLFGLQPGQVVENFRLLDESGNSHELHYYKDATAIVVMVQGNGCQIDREDGEIRDCPRGTEDERVWGGDDCLYTGKVLLPPRKPHTEGHWMGYSLSPYY